jgi:hypothetical protein
VLDGNPSPGFVFRNNLLTHGTYGVKGPGLATGMPSLDKSMPGFTWENNLFLSAADLSKRYPRGTRFVPSVGFAEDGYTQTAFPGVGVDAAKLTAAIAGVR